VKTLKKRKTPYAEGLPKKNTNFDASIVSDFDNEKQGDFWRSSFISQLDHFIELQKLSDCLELLELHGFQGETALFMLKCLQQSGGAA